MPRLLIAASGTGGHLFPAIAVAEALPKSYTIHWLGVSDRLEVQVLPEKFKLTTIPVAALQGRGFRKVLQLLQLLLSTFSVIRLIQTERIQLVFTTGGYIAAPAILAAKICGVKVILHESNAFPGKVTRLLGRWCNVVALGLPMALDRLRNCKTLITGTPVRRDFLVKQSLPAWVPSGPGPLIIAVGGSQGAIGLNQMVRAAIPSFLEKGCRVVHLTGENDNQKLVHPCLVERAFDSDMAGLLQHADLAISRAGAGTLCELALCGTPTIFIPYPYAADNHQDFNAAYAAEHGAALIVLQHDPAHDGLTRALSRLLEPRFTSNQQPGLLDQMRRNMETIAVKDSHQKLVALINDYF